VYVSVFKVIAESSTSSSTTDIQARSPYNMKLQLLS